MRESRRDRAACLFCLAGGLQAEVMMSRLKKYLSMSESGRRIKGSLKKQKSHCEGKHNSFFVSAYEMGNQMSDSWLGREKPSKSQSGYRIYYLDGLG